MNKKNQFPHEKLMKYDFDFYALPDDKSCVIIEMDFLSQNEAAINPKDGKLTL